MFRLTSLSLTEQQMWAA